jgi:hypothetical protein
MITETEARAQQQHWLERAESAAQSQDPSGARDARAMAERMTRILYRLSNLPSGDAFPMAVALLRIGNACWLAVEAELYNLFQRSLRERFPHIPIIVATLTNGARATYLPTRESYGTGVYQESIALLAPGSLERLIDCVADEITKLFE